MQPAARIRSGSTHSIKAFLILAVMLSSALVIGGPGPAKAGDQLAASRAIQDRSVFGLAVDGQTLATLAAGKDTGSARWGIPLTAEEEARLDLNGRMMFEAALDMSFLPYVRSLPEYAGVWIDQVNGGRVVVMLTDPRPDLELAIRSHLPVADRGLMVERASRSYAQLLAAASEAGEALAAEIPGIKSISVAVDVAGNRIRIGTAAIDLAAALLAGSAVERVIGVPVVIVEASTGSDATCNTREDCHSPLKPGVQIHRGSTTSTWYCTMSWQIHIGTDEQFLTAGHCGHFSPNSWYHQGYVNVNQTGLVGNELGTLYVNGGKDAMRVAILDSQVTGDVYGQPDTGSLSNGSLPIVGEVVCASLGKSNVIDCGTVSDDWVSWNSETANYTVWGADTTGILPIKGDSGSPLYKRVNIGDDIVIHPKGIIDHEDGFFARITDVLSAFGATIVK